MLFSIRERIALVSILPERGNAATLRMLREFQDAISFTQAEKDAIELTHTDETFVWNQDKAEPKDIEVCDTIKGLIVDGLKKRDNENALHISHMELYDRFLPE